MQIEKSLETEIVFDFMDSLIFILEKVLDFALIENLVKPSFNTDSFDSFVALKVFSDINLLIHFFLILINGNSETNATSNLNSNSDKNSKITSIPFYYFIFNFENAFKNFLNFFENSDFTEKLKILLDNDKNCAKLQNLFQFSPSFEFWNQIKIDYFLEKLGNAILLSKLDPYFWEPPNIPEGLCFSCPEYFVQN